MSDGKILIFLESNTKKLTIKSFLGADYNIFATGGHLMELENKGIYNLGVDFDNNFKPSYLVMSKKKALVDFWINYLEKNKPSQIFVATDPDREGEAIAKEVVEVLNLKEKDYKRLLFHEITSSSIKKSLENPLEIDDNLVQAQLSRQVLDKMIGFCLSPLLQKKINAWSAGRVQSVVLKLIVDKEKEIELYGDKKEFVIDCIYKVGKKSFSLNERDFNGNLVIYETQNDAQKVIDELKKNFDLEEKFEEEKYVFPKSPLTTSLLLYEAKNKLGFSIYKTTEIAQKLYEGVSLKGKKKRLSLITYPRTDSSRLSKTFTFKAYEYIKEKWGTELCNFKDSSVLKGKKKNVQDAHEAIRPTYMNYTPDDLKGEGIEEDYISLYELIFNHTLASLMQPAKYISNIYNFSNNGRKFQMVENIIISPGFFVFLDYYKKFSISKDSSLINEDINNIEASKIGINEYLGRRPRRYTEGILIKTLEKLGIGRPSTYNAFSRILLKRRYSTISKRGEFIPTVLGFNVNEWLQNHFSYLINENYTALLEEKLDKISQGDDNYLSFIKSFWSDFFPRFKDVDCD